MLTSQTTQPGDKKGVETAWLAAVHGGKPGGAKVYILYILPIVAASLILRSRHNKSILITSCLTPQALPSDSCTQNPPPINLYSQIVEKIYIDIF